MRLLLDTHILLWGASEPEKLSSRATALIEDPENDLLFSAISIWEVALKAPRRADFLIDPSVLRRDLVDNGYAEVPLASTHVLALAGLPAIHKDPFDRMLVAQAIVEGATLLTSDGTLARYPGPIRLL